jgi:hypothetical protein
LEDEAIFVKEKIEKTTAEKSSIGKNRFFFI